MKIENEHVSEKKIVGETQDKEPILYILTHGGLHCFFQKSKDGIKTLAMAPHKAMAQWMAEKADPKIKWIGEMSKSENLFKSDSDLHDKLLAFFAIPLVTDFPKSPLYVGFDTSNGNINLYKKEDLIKMSYNDKVNFIIRNIALDSFPDLLLNHGDFK